MRTAGSEAIVLSEEEEGPPPATSCGRRKTAERDKPDVGAGLGWFFIGPGFMTR